MMTAYDYPSSKAISDAEIDIILVGITCPGSFRL